MKGRQGEGGEERRAREVGVERAEEADNINGQPLIHSLRHGFFSLEQRNKSLIYGTSASALSA
jgi:hypothetical protein